MEEFENFSSDELRSILIETMEKAKGMHYVYGWLAGTFIAGYVSRNDNREQLIAEILEYRKLIFSH
jgi:hypothetical protein